jgi:hypothetical protein
MSSFKFSEDALKRLTTDAVQKVAAKGKQRLKYVTCPVHHSQHQVRWEMDGDTIKTSVSDSCCEELNKVLASETENAIQ